MKRFLLFAVVATLFAACSKDALDEQQGIQNIVDEAPATLTVGFEDDETRIQLNEELKTVWTNGDLVSVFYRSDANQQWQYTGETGARTASLKRVYTAEATTKLPKVVVVYPYNDSYYINPVSCNIEATMPAEQTYLKDSYGLDGNIMISSDEFNQISLKSVYGWLKLQLTGNGEQIKSITVRGNSGEQMAGLVYIDSSDATTTLAAEMGSADDPDVGGAGGNLVFEDTVLTEVTLNCLDGSSPTEKGVEVANTATAFYIALPPQTFTKGITVEITDTTNFTMTQSTDKEVVIERNHIKPMSAFKFVNPNTPTLPTPANNEVWYTATAKVEPYYTDEFGATYVSNMWNSETGKGVITFEGDVTKIGYYAFYDCYSLTSVTIPDSVKTIGERAFRDCDSLTSVTIPDSVTTIGEEAFRGCDSLTSVTIGNSVTTIGEYAFYYCTSLTSVTIPDSVTTIGNDAFSVCDSLTSVTIGDSVTTVGVQAFSSCRKLTSVTIGNSVTTIGNYAFEYCESLTSVTIPDSVTTIGYGAFYGCDSLKEFKGKFVADGGRCLIMDNTLIAYAYASGTTYTIPNSVTTIGDCAFYDCSSLTSVTIGNSVTTIGDQAFDFCESLKYVYCKPTTPPTGGWDMFDYNAAGRRIFVPASDDDSIINAYKAKKYWSDYADYIFEDASL